MLVASRHSHPSAAEAAAAADAVPGPAIAPPAGALPGADALPRRTRVWMLVLPLVGLALAWAGAWVFAGRSHASQAAAAAFASLAGLGTSVIFGAAVLGATSFLELTTLELAIIVVVLNTALTIVYVGAFDLLERLPWAGPKLERARTTAVAAAVERPWIRRWATAGVALFVISPLPGSGALGGTLVSRIVGLSRTRTFISVAVANAIVCGVYALGADSLELWMERSHMTTTQRVVLVLATVAMVLLLLRWIVLRTMRPVPGKTS